MAVSRLRGASEDFTYSYDQQEDDPECIIAYLDLMNDFIRANLPEEFNIVSQ